MGRAWKGIGGGVASGTETERGNGGEGLDMWWGRQGVGTGSWPRGSRPPGARQCLQQLTGGVTGR
jgi:hypothetical protein